MNSKGERENAGISYSAFVSYSNPVHSPVPNELSSHGKGQCPQICTQQTIQAIGQQIGLWPLNVQVEEVIKHCKVN